MNELEDALMLEREEIKVFLGTGAYLWGKSMLLLTERAIMFSVCSGKGKKAI